MAANPMSHPVNDTFWSAAGLAQASGGAWRQTPSAARATGVSIDSRTVQPGELFVALRGEQFDGHDFVRDALNKGAIGALVERGATQLGDVEGPMLEVDDTLAALQRLARTWRDALRERGCTVIAVAGSNGKTTTRHLIHHLLHAAPTHTGETLRGTQSPKSFNNDIGVPLTLLGASADDDFLVVEIGTNQPGEIARLGALVRPNIAVIVSIGQEHLEGFGTIERVAEEELSLLRFVEPGGMAFMPAEDWLDAHRPALAKEVTLRHIAGDALVERSLTLPGAHALHNASAAAQVARMMSVDDAHIAAALADAEPVPGRFVVRPIGELMLIDDTYNANPDSVRAALTTVAQHWPAARRRVFVFGDMLELGDVAVASHREIGRLVAEAKPGFALLVAVGALATFAAAELRRLKPTAEVHAAPQWDDALPQRVAKLLEPGDVVLLKGSRSMRLERMIPAIEAAFGERTMCC